MDDLPVTAAYSPDGALGPPSAPSDTTLSPLSSRSSLYLELVGDDWDKISVSSAQSDAERDAGRMQAREVDDEFLYLDSEDGSKAANDISAGECIGDDENKTMQSGQTTPSFYSDTTSRAASPDLVFQDEEPAPRPSSPYLTEEEIKLDLGLLSNANYDLFTTPVPVEPSWQPEILEGMLRLFKDCAMKTHLGDSQTCDWKIPPEILMDEFDSHGALRPVLRKKPDGEFIRNNYQLGRAKGLPYLDDDLQTHLLNILETVRWVYDDEAMDIEAVHYLLKYAPLPLQYLIRSFAYVIPLREGVAAAKATLTDYLQSQSPLSRRQSSALVMLDWLAEPRSPDRRTLLFTRPDGTPRVQVDAEEPWAWFFDRAGRGYPYDAGVLDEWEKTLLAEEDWDIACA